MTDMENDPRAMDGEEEEIVEEYADPDAASQVVLTDENGREVTFEFLDLILLGGSEYVVLLPLDVPDADEVVIFRVEGEGDEESYVGISDDAEAQAVYEEFKRRNRDVFSFEE